MPWLQERLVAMGGKLVTLKEQAGEAPNGTQFMITTGPTPELDATNLIVGKVCAGGSGEGGGKRGHMDSHELQNQQSLQHQQNQQHQPHQRRQMWASCDGTSPCSTAQVAAPMVVHVFPAILERRQPKHVVAVLCRLSIAGGVRL